jgi:hypothetical protein
MADPEQVREPVDQGTDFAASLLVRGGWKPKKPRGFDASNVEGKL